MTYLHASRCKWAGCGLPAQRPHVPQAVTRAIAAAHIAPQVFAGFAAARIAPPVAAVTTHASKLAVKTAQALMLASLSSKYNKLMIQILQHHTCIKSL